MTASASAGASAGSVPTSSPKDLTLSSSGARMPRSDGQRRSSGRLFGLSGVYDLSGA